MVTSRPGPWPVTSASRLRTRRSVPGWVSKPTSSAETTIRADRDLQTFNALFPKGKYFGELSLLGPANLINLHPSIGAVLGAGWSLSVASVFYWRHSTGDGIYDIAGNLIRGDQGSKAHFIGTQAEVVVEYAYGRNVGFLASYSQFRPGRYIKDTGPSETVHFVGAEIEFRF